MIKKFFKKSVATISSKDSGKQQKINEEKLSERALHLLKKLDF